MQFTLNDETVEVEVDRIEPDGTFEARVGERVFTGRFERRGEGEIRLLLDGRFRTIHLASNGTVTEVFLGGRVFAIERAARERKKRSEGEGLVAPPMPSVVTRILVTVGAEVKRGDPLLIVSAMKMEHTLSAPHAGIVRAIHASPDAQVMPGVNLVEIEPLSSPPEG